MDIEARIQRIEDDRAIRDLKMRYLRASDAKDPESMRGCFLPDAKILFDGFPPFEARDPFSVGFGNRDGDAFVIVVMFGVFRYVLQITSLVLLKM